MNRFDVTIMEQDLNSGRSIPEDTLLQYAELCVNSKINVVDYLRLKDKIVANAMLPGKLKSLSLTYASNWYSIFHKDKR